MSNIRISRYLAPDDQARADVAAGMQERGVSQLESPFPSDHWGGIIEPDDKSWIIWLDADGVPSHYFPRREDNGGVACEPILLKELPVVPA